VIISGIPTTVQNFIQISDKGFRFCFLRKRDFAHPFSPLFFSFFWVFSIAYSKDARTDFDTAYVKDAVPRKDVPFEGPEPKI